MPTKRAALAASAALLFGFVFLCAFPSAALGQEPEESLYDRLGGVYNIAAVVDDLIDRLAANEALNANPGIGSARVPARFPGLKFQLTAMVCEATGGPCGYTGESMEASHIDMGITAADWQLFEADCKATLDKFEVPEAEQEELFAIIGSTRGDIVVAE